MPVRRVKALTSQDRLERQLLDDTHKELTSMEKVWAYATGVASINDPKQTYTVPQIKKMWAKSHQALLTLIEVGAKDGPKENKRMGQAELARRLGVSQSTISYRLPDWCKR